MNKELPVKLIKKAERKSPQPQTKLKFVVGQNGWSTAVQSWVSEFQRHRRGESLPAFNSLFK